VTLQNETSCKERSDLSFRDDIDKNGADTIATRKRFSVGRSKNLWKTRCPMMQLTATLYDALCRSVSRQRRDLDKFDFALRK